MLPTVRLIMSSRSVNPELREECATVTTIVVRPSVARSIDAARSERRRELLRGFAYLKPPED